MTEFPVAGPNQAGSDEQDRPGGLQSAGSSIGVGTGPHEPQPLQKEVIVIGIEPVTGEVVTS